ncbi:hypothetical protein Fmac_009576 [Flemingia macrophylla]|uniref:Single-stranded DNA binding protein Ssb-like OB fold domain-containing protein n=1 Tax=Flemingia macrophylla TaxID=520843 RepID=A0ABD1N0M2_9FABA
MIENLLETLKSTEVVRLPDEGTIGRVDQLKPGTNGHTLTVKVVSSKPVKTVGGRGGRSTVLAVRPSRIAECLVGDETGTIIFTACNEQVDLINVGAILILRNAKIDMFKGSMRLVVDRWGRIEYYGNNNNSDERRWNVHRQISSHQFNTRALRKFMETVVDSELHERLLPFLATRSTIPDYQDILHHFTFNNICKITFGFDLEYLFPSLSQTPLSLLRQGH